MLDVMVDAVTIVKHNGKHNSTTLVNRTGTVLILLKPHRHCLGQQVWVLCLLAVTLSPVSSSTNLQLWWAVWMTGRSRWDGVLLSNSGWCQSGSQWVSEKPMTQQTQSSSVYSLLKAAASCKLGLGTVQQHTTAKHFLLQLALFSNCPLFCQTFPFIWCLLLLGTCGYCSCFPIMVVAQNFL